MKVFYTTGLVDEKLTLAEVEEVEWPKGYRQWVYETYPKCYQVIKEIATVEISKIGWDFWKKIKENLIGSLPGVHPVYSAPDDAVKYFLETKERVAREEEEKRRREEEERLRKRKEREEKEKLFKIVQVHKKIYPRGGENGIDGYWDGTLEYVATGEKIRMVARNVFDFGYYCYPKRVEGTDEVFKKENWTEIEQKVVEWLKDFPPIFDGMRM